jgi:hypothetical protein
MDFTSFLVTLSTIDPIVLIALSGITIVVLTYKGYNQMVVHAKEFAAREAAERAAKEALDRESANALADSLRLQSEIEASRLIVEQLTSEIATRSLVEGQLAAEIEASRLIVEQLTSEITAIEQNN